MGYLTKYDLEVRGEWIPSEEEIVEQLGYINPDYFNWNVHYIDDLFWEEMKWYDHDEDMLELSRRFPNGTVFTLYGKGEEDDDIWKTEYCNGDIICHYVGKIVYTPWM